MELVEPTTKYKDAFIEAVYEYQSTTSAARRFARYREFSVDELQSDFSSFIERKEKMSKGIDLKPEFVPQTDFWLVDGGRYFGTVSIRHRLNEKLLDAGGHIGYDIRPSEQRKGYGKMILKLALPKARELGLTKVLLTCDETNEGSRKIIEANGGVFEDKRPNPEGGPDKLRYWIQI